MPHADIAYVLTGKSPCFNEETQASLYPLFYNYNVSDLCIKFGPGRRIYLKTSYYVLTVKWRQNKMSYFS